MVAAHGWDCAGAQAAGLRTAWIARGEHVLPPSVAEPDMQVADLAGLAAGAGHAPAPVHRTLGWIRRSCQGCLGKRGEVCSCFGRRAVGVALE